LRQPSWWAWGFRLPSGISVGPDESRVLR
jgi:hypothetical protein